MDYGVLLWEPTSEQIEQSQLTRFVHWLKTNKKVTFDDYHELQKWSVDNYAQFWNLVAQYFNVHFHERSDVIVDKEEMPGVRWFPGAKLNFAEHIFRMRNDFYPAVVSESEIRPYEELSWNELLKQVTALQSYLQSIGVKEGDRVVAYISNIPEAIVSVLAVTGLGAIWSSCSPDFGKESVLNRFQQIQPKVLIAVDGYRYHGKDYDRLGIIKELQENLPTLEKTILIPYLNTSATGQGLKEVVLWQEVVRTEGVEPNPIAVPVEFNTPLWILYSSGTTGLPKPITHSHGGILLEHLKYLHFHAELKRGDRFFWYTTTGWMMWNMVVGSLLTGATAVLYDGSPTLLDAFWEFIARSKMTYFGTSAPYIHFLMKQDYKPSYDLSEVRAVGSTGAPLTPDGFRWVYEKLGSHIWLNSLSGGTDVCTAFVGGCIWLPVYSGEIQCRCLGAPVEVFNEKGKPIRNEVGELVLTKPMPSMPVFFWNDPQFERYKASYFEMFPGIWRHGDWACITERQTVIIYGRSDATLKKQGVRMGTSEFYAVVDKIPEIKDSLVVSLELPDGSFYMPLFVTLNEGYHLTPMLIEKIKRQIREELSPKHLPDEIVEAPGIPYTLNGKKMETPVKRILLNFPIEKAVNKGSMQNPEVIDFYIQFRDQRVLPMLKKGNNP